MEKRLKQERLSEGRRLGWSTERKMKWKLISFKIKRRETFSTQDWMWLWGVLKISRFIESTGERDEQTGGERWRWGRRKGGKLNRTENSLASAVYFELSSSLYRFLSLDWRADWLIDSFCLEIAWWIVRPCTHFRRRLLKYRIAKSFPSLASWQWQRKPFLLFHAIVGRE